MIFILVLHGQLSVASETPDEADSASLRNEVNIIGAVKTIILLLNKILGSYILPSILDLALNEGDL